MSRDKYSGNHTLESLEGAIVLESKDSSALADGVLGIVLNTATGAEGGTIQLWPSGNIQLNSFDADISIQGENITNAATGNAFITGDYLKLRGTGIATRLANIGESGNVYIDGGGSGSLNTGEIRLWSRTKIDIGYQYPSATASGDCPQEINLTARGINLTADSTTDPADGFSSNTHLEMSSWGTLALSSSGLLEISGNGVGIGVDEVALRMATLGHIDISAGGSSSIIYMDPGDKVKVLGTLEVTGDLEVTGAISATDDLVVDNMVVTGKISGTADAQTLKLSSEDGNNFIIVNNDSILINQNGNNSLSIADQSYMLTTGGDFLTASVDDGVFQVFGWGADEGGGRSHPVVFVNLDTNDQADVLKLMIGTPNPIGTNKFIRFTCDSGNTVDRSAGTDLGSISANGNGGVQFTHSFTGSHACIMETADENKPGLIVSSTGKIWMKKDNISQATPKVALASTHKDKNVYGVIAKINPESYAGYVKANGKSNTEDCIEVNSVGDGRIWVTNILGEVLLGDYITSSDIAGFGARQDDDILRSYTVAKCTESIDWESIMDVVEADGSSYKRYLSACTYHCG